MSRRPAITIALAMAMALTLPAAAQAAMPVDRVLLRRHQGRRAVSARSGINLYKYKGKTLVTAATRIPTKDFVCQPSGTRGTKGPPTYKISLGGMAPKSNGSFKGKDTPFFGPPTITVSGKFTSAKKVDVTFTKDHNPVGPAGENCVAKKRFVVSLKKQKTNKGLPF